MLKHHLGEELQSAYMRGHSTETALLKVKDEIMGHVYNQKGVFLVLLDLSAAFDTVNHDLLLSRMSHEIGVTGVALDWLKSYFTGRTTTVVIDLCDASCAPGQGTLLQLFRGSEVTYMASQNGHYVLPQRVALESNALLSQPTGVELLSTRCFRKQRVA